MDELPTQQHNIPDRDNFSCLGEETVLPSCLPIIHLINMCRRGEPFIKGHPKVTGSIDLLDWISEEVNWSGFRDALSGLKKDHRKAFRNINGYLPNI
jgi:hypothetical protein